MIGYQNLDSLLLCGNSGMPVWLLVPAEVGRRFRAVLRV